MSAEADIQAAIAATPELASLLTASEFQKEIDAFFHGYAQNPAIRIILQNDLGMLGRQPRLFVRDGITLTYPVARSLQERVRARGTPLQITQNETVPDLAGISTSVGYTVPPGREARIDFMSISVQGTDAVPNDNNNAWYRTELRMTPSGAPISELKNDVISNFNTGSPGPKTLVLQGPLYLNQFDRVNGILIQVTLDPALTSYTGFFTIMGVEKDVGYLL